MCQSIRWMLQNFEITVIFLKDQNDSRFGKTYFWFELRKKDLNLTFYWLNESDKEFWRWALIFNLPNTAPYCSFVFMFYGTPHILVNSGGIIFCSLP